MDIDRKKTLLVAVAVEALVTFCFAISSFVVADTANAGFNVVLTGLLYMAYCGGTYYVISKSHTPLAVGFLIGSTGAMCLVSLQTAIYWGQLANCEDIKGSIDQYSCDNTSAYGAVSAFASIMFIFLLVSTVLIVLWRDDLIGETGLYDEIGGPAEGKGNAYSNAPYDASGFSGNSQGAYAEKQAYNQQTATADL